MSVRPRIVPLGDVCDVVGGGTPSKDRPEFYGGTIPWATVRDMHSDVIKDTEFRITSLGVANSATNIIPAGNVIIATRVGLGKVSRLETDTAINQDLRSVVPKKRDQIFVPYLFWWLKSVAHLIVAAGTGATVQGVKLAFVRSLPFPLIDFAEQQRIVAILDEAFEGLATATANIKTNLTTANDLFSLVVDAAFGAAREGNAKRPLSDLVEVTHGYAFEGNHFVEDEGDLPILLTPGNFTEEGALKFSPKNTKRFSGPVPKGFVLEQDDLVIVMTDLSSKMKILGRPAIVDRRGLLHNQRIGRVRFLGDEVEASYLYFFFLTSGHLDHIRRSSTGTMVKHTAPKRITSGAIFLPSREEQRVTARRLSGLKKGVEKIKQACAERMAALDLLKGELLTLAFSGRLSAKRRDRLVEAAE